MPNDLDYVRIPTNNKTWVCFFQPSRIDYSRSINLAPKTYFYNELSITLLEDGIDVTFLSGRNQFIYKNLENCVTDHISVCCEQDENYSFHNCSECILGVTENNNLALLQKEQYIRVPLYDPFDEPLFFEHEMSEIEKFLFK